MEKCTPIKGTQRNLVYSKAERDHGNENILSPHFVVGEPKGQDQGWGQTFGVVLKLPFGMHYNE